MWWWLYVYICSSGCSYEVLVCHWRHSEQGTALTSNNYNIRPINRQGLIATSRLMTNRHVRLPYYISHWLMVFQCQPIGQISQYPQSDSAHQVTVPTKWQCSPSDGAHQVTVHINWQCTPSDSVHQVTVPTKWQCPPSDSAHQVTVPTKWQCSPSDGTHQVTVPTKWHCSSVVSLYHCSGIDGSSI